MATPYTVLALLCACVIAASSAEEGKCSTAGCEDRPIVPRILVGCWQLTERYGRADAVKALMTYAEHGFMTFDTADIYGPSEGIIGEFRQQFAAKHGADKAAALEFYTKYVTQDASLAEAQHINARSNQALGAVPHVVQMHWWDFSDRGDIKAAGHLAALKAEGKLRHLAACNYDSTHLRTLLDASLPITVNQVQYSLLDRRPETGMIELATAHKIQLTCFGVVAGGWLSDRYLGISEGDAMATLRGPDATVSLRMYKSSLDAWSGRDWDLFQSLLQELRQVADRHRTSIAVVATCWVLERLAETCGGGVILGIRDTRHIKDAEAARDLRLTAADMQGIKQVLDKGNSPRGDIWSRERRRI